MSNIKVQSIYCALFSAYDKSSRRWDFLSESILPIKLFPRPLITEKKKMVNKSDNLLISYYYHTPTEYMAKSRMNGEIV